jgi:hypothetical protein
MAIAPSSTAPLDADQYRIVVSEHRSIVGSDRAATS